MGFLRNNPYIAGGVTLLVLLVGIYIMSLRGTVEDLRTDLADERAAHTQTIKNYTTAAALAQTTHDAEIASIEAYWKGQVEDAKTEYTARLADANDGVVRWKTRTITITSPTSDGQTAQITGPASGFAPEGMSLVDDSDVRICTENTVKLIGYDKFYMGLRSQPEGK